MAFDYLDASNCLKYTEMEFEDIISLTGIFGIHPDLEGNTDKLTEKGLGSISLYYGIISGANVKFEFESDRLKKYKILVNFKEKTIFNDLIRTQKNVTGVSLPAIESQTAAAKRLKFPTIELHAYGQPGDKSFIGHKVWAKYGFKMGETDFEKFQNKTSKFKTPPKDLNELLTTTAGQNFWDSNGFPWLGIFEVNEEDCTSLLKKARSDYDQKRIREALAKNN